MPRLGPSGPSGGDSASEIPAGEYIIALKSFKRATAKSSGNEYLRCTWVICAGPLEGERFYSNVSLDLSKEGSVNRWRIWMEACGVDNEFEIGSIAEGTQAEGDRNIRDLFVGQPFVATIKVERNGQYTNHDIDRIHYVRLWTQEQKDAMDRWLETQQSAGQPGSRPEVGGEGNRGGGGGRADDWTGGGGGDDQDYGPAGGGTQTGGFAGGDDDIPF